MMTTLLGASIIDVCIEGRRDCCLPTKLVASVLAPWRVAWSIEPTADCRILRRGTVFCLGWTCVTVDLDGRVHVAARRSAWSRG